MSQNARSIDTDKELPYCDEYWAMVANQDIERLAALEQAYAEISSAVEYWECNGVPSLEPYPQIGLDEFEEIFRTSPFVY